MAKKLVIVESPHKSKTIEKYLGKDYKVVSSLGHIRDLSTSGKFGFGVDVENDFKPDYKIINGIPFYTRLWKESIDQYGNNVLDSTAYSMDNALAAVEELGLNTEWDSEVKQYVAKGMADDIYYSIWLEEDSSIAAKMELVKKYNLSGIAAWCLGMEKSSVWDIITE